MYQTQLQRCQNQIRDLIINGHVPRADDPSKENIIIVQKHKTPANDKFHDLPYYVARIE